MIESELTDFNAYIGALQQEINKRLKVEVRKKAPPNLYEPIRYVLALKAKRLRPILLILSCEAVGGKFKDCIDAALAIEMLHSFTLVHDDIMDGDTYRRGYPTIHNKWDSNVAILAGDALIALAYQALQRTASSHMRLITKIFSQGIIEVCEGQSLDKDFESIKEVSTRDYINMVEKKTGSLMSISTQIGGILGNGTNAQTHALTSYGDRVGIAFQIQDDLLDIIAEEKALGKDLGSDLSQGKKTYPFLLLMDRATNRDKIAIRKILRQRAVSADDLQYAKTLLVKYNIISDIESDVHKRLRTADNILRKLPDPFCQNNLLEFSNMIEKRAH